MNTVNETLIREVVAEVLGRLGGGSAPKSSAPVSAAGACACTDNNQASSTISNLRGKYGVFPDANEAPSG